MAVVVDGLRFAAALLAAGVLLAGCGRSVALSVVTSLPPPVVARLPLEMGVHYGQVFRERTYAEDSKDRPDWHIDTRQARRTLFDTVLPAMFERVIEVPQPRAPADTAIDAILEPVPVDLQLAVPGETGAEFYEAWVKFRIRLLDPGGQLLAEWDLAGYGRQRSNGSVGVEPENLNAAIDNAYRDLGARLVLGFRKQAAVADWLCRHPRVSVAALPAATGDGVPVACQPSVGG